jgi:hypothetical protein
LFSGPVRCNPIESTKNGYHSGGGKLVFPSQSKPDEHITTNALIQVLRRLGYKSTREEGESFVTHAFRGLASTTLYQKLQYPGDYIETVSVLES